MTKKMLIDAAHPEEVRVALIAQNKIEDFDFESAARKPLRGNIYLARVTRVEPSLQAAFVEYGGNRHGFLAFSEIHSDYYQIPVSDRQLLQEAEAEVAELAAALELAQRGDERFDEDDEDEDAADDDLPPELVAGADEDDTADDETAEDETEQTPDDDEEEQEEEEEEEDVKKEDASLKDKDADPDEEEQKAEESRDADSADIEELGDDAPEIETEPAAESASESAEDEEDGAAPEEPETKAADDKKKARKSKKAKDDRDELFERYKEAKRKRSQLLRNYKIQEVIKRRQILLVQVVKEERGTKGAALTTYLSLAGRYCVLMPNTARGGGISRKIANGSDRRRLRRVVDGLDVPQGMGLIIRTAGAKRTKTEIKRDYDYLLRLWENIRTLTLKSIAPCLIYEEASLIKRAIRDLYDKDISKVLVEGEEGYREAKDFMKMLMPSHAKYVQPYKERAPIFLRYGVETQLDGMYQPSVRLKSGGYIVIHQTEALVAIDVNSGRATRERNIEQTALRTNIEAAEEAARQFRLRDLAGLIVIDFIDMEEMRNNRKVEKAFKEALKADRARIQAGRISAFGLLELSRQRRRSGLVDGTTHACPTCAGAGVIRSHETAALRILRGIEGEAIAGKAGKIVARASLDVSLHMLNSNREWIKRIEDDNGVEIEILADPEKAGDAYDLEKSGAPRERDTEQTHIRADQTAPVDIDDEEIAADETADEKDADKESGRKRRRRRRSRKDAAGADKKKDANAEAGEDDGAAADSDDDQEASAADGDNGEDRKPKRRRRRGRRGGRRNRRDAGSDEQKAKTEPAAAEADDPDSAAAPNEAVENPPEDSVEQDAVSEEPAAAVAPSVADDPVPEDAGETTGKPNGAAEDEPAQADASTNETAPVPEPAPPADEPEKAKKSSRKGWWQRPIG